MLSWLVTSRMKRTPWLPLLALVLALPALAAKKPVHRIDADSDAAWPGDRLVDPTARQTALAGLGRYVALASRCGLRDDVWAERLDVALIDAMQEASGGIGARDDSQLLLTSTELRAVKDWKANAERACAALRGRPAADLRKADELAGGGATPG